MSFKNEAKIHKIGKELSQALAQFENAISPTLQKKTQSPEGETLLKTSESSKEETLIPPSPKTQELFKSIQEQLEFFSL